MSSNTTGEEFSTRKAAKLKDMDAKFSKAPSEYVQGISRAHVAEESTAGDYAEKPATRIATIIHRLRDPESKPAKPGTQPTQSESK